MKYILDDHVHYKTDELTALNIEFAIDYFIKSGDFHMDDLEALSKYLHGYAYDRAKLQRVIGLLDSLLDMNDNIQCKNATIQKRIDQILAKLDRTLL